MSKKQGKIDNIQIKPYTAFLENLFANMHFKKSQYTVKTDSGSGIIDNFTSDDLANLDQIGRILGGFVDAKYIHELEDFIHILKTKESKRCK